MNLDALYAFSCRGPSARNVSTCRDVLESMYLHANCGGLPTHLSDVALARAYDCAAVVLRHERTHRAAVLYVVAATGSPNPDGVTMARRDHHEARRLVAALRGEAQRRTAMHRAGLRLLAKAARA